METFFIVMLFLQVFILLGCVYALLRNQQVYDFRMMRLKEASQCARFIINVGGEDSHQDYIRPYRRLERYSYDDMMYSLKPLEYFLPDNWLDDLYAKYAEIDNAQRAACLREKLMGKRVLVEATSGNVEENKQGRSESDAGCGEVEQGEREANTNNS